MTASTAIATLFGIGRVRFAPGTAASFVAVPFAWGIAVAGGRTSLLVAVVLATSIGTWACDRYVHDTGKVDPSECVIDELAGQWLALVFAPREYLAYSFGFILFRALDILKPWPLSAAEKLPGGLGVMADDILAGLLTGLLVAGAKQVGVV